MSNTIWLQPCTSALPEPHEHKLRSLQGIREQAAEQHDPLTILLRARRAGILRSLQRPATTTMVSAALGIAPSTTSEHLRALLAIGAVRRVRKRNEVFYELDRPAVS
jgi:DNA-binding transcriptional ArsR family regulator